RCSGSDGASPWDRAGRSGGGPSSPKCRRGVWHATARFGGVPLDELDPAFVTLAPHHLATCRNVVAEFEGRPEVLAVLLAGSIAHGYARPDSDVDIAIVVTPEELDRRAAAGRLTYFDQSLATWEGGYVDGKYHDL